jgi:ABC-type Na+ efflux pump permease subunit
LETAKFGELKETKIMQDQTRPNRMRIILAITRKDIQDALRNRILITIMIGVAIVMLQGRALPLLIKLSDRVQVAVFNEGEGPIVEDLRSHGEIHVIGAASSQELQQLVGEASGSILGIVAPPDYGSDHLENNEILLEGFHAYWMDPGEVAEFETMIERHLREMTGSVVNIDTDAAYAQPDSGGQPFMSAMVMMLMTILICVVVVPYLMIEEKQAHTMQSLLVSPARIGDVVLGKALAGLVYGLAAGVVVLAFYHAQIVHCWIAIATCITGSLLAVALGLLLGSLFENIPAMNLWMGLLVIILIGAVLVGQYVPAHWPASITAILPWIPTVTLYKTYMLSFTESPSVYQVGTNLGVILVMTSLLLAIVAGIVRRSDR